MRVKGKRAEEECFAEILQPCLRKATQFSRVLKCGSAKCVGLMPGSRFLILKTQRAEMSESVSELESNRNIISSSAVRAYVRPSASALQKEQAGSPYLGDVCLYQAPFPACFLCSQVHPTSHQVHATVIPILRSTDTESSAWFEVT